MSTLPTVTSSQIVPSRPSKLSRAHSKARDHALAEQSIETQIAASRIVAKATTTAFALQGLGMLQREAEHQSSGDPTHDARQAFLLDRYTEAAGNIIRGFGE